MSSLDENPNCAQTHATFRLAGDALVPDEVSGALGLTPTRALAKGQEVQRNRRGTPGPVQPTGVWLLDTERSVESTSLERHLIHLLDQIEPSAAALAELRARGLEADFFCFWVSARGHGGPEVSADTLGRIAALGAPLGIDFYRSND